MPAARCTRPSHLYSSVQLKPYAVLASGCLGGVGGVGAGAFLLAPERASETAVR